MTTILIDGTVKVVWCNTIVNIAAPTTAELNGGTPLESYIRPDGLDIAMATGGVDNSNLASTFTTERAGRRKPSISIMFHHQAGTDTPFNLLPYRTSGFLVVRRGIAVATAWTTSQLVAVYPGETGETDEQKPAPDTNHDFMVPVFVSADPNVRAVVA